MIPEFIWKLRGSINRLVNPASGYRLAPASRKFGFDRGRPIDRYWIETFLDRNRSLIKGRVLEVTDSVYTKKFGGNRVSRSDVLDINPKNRKAGIIGDLRKLKGIRSGTYDCLILTHVLGLIDDPAAAISECHRILKSRGVLLLTSSCLGPLFEKVYWRFTPYSVRYLLTKNFPESGVTVSSYGNALAGQSFFVGLAQEDLPVGSLDYHDPQFPCIVAAVAFKK